MTLKMSDNKQYVILMNGYSACLKTYTARRIANVLRIPLIETNRLGSCVSKDGILDDVKRDRRYNIAFQQSTPLIKNGFSLVIDGTFNFKKWREPLYDHLTDYNIQDVVVVRCVCDDEDIIDLRIQERQKNKVLPENEAAKMENYFKTKKDDEPVFEDGLPAGGVPSIIKFRTGPEYTVEVVQGESDVAVKIRDIIWRDFHTGKLNEH